MKIWNKFYECNCCTEGIMLSYEYQEKDDKGVEYPLIDLGFFRQGFGNDNFSFKEKLKYTSDMFKYNKPWTDMVILDPQTAHKLGKDLLSWANKRSRNANRSL